MSSNFRDLSWVRPEIDKLLARFRAAFCVYDLAGYHSPLTITADFALCAFLHDRSNFIKSLTAPTAFAAGAKVEDWAKI